MKVFSYILKYKLLVIIVLIFLAFQGFFNMMLPYVTSDVINVGIQQYGIDHIAPEYISLENFEKFNTGFQKELRSNTEATLTISDYDEGEKNINDEDAKYNLTVFYEKSDDNYHITQAGSDNWDSLDKLLKLPLVQLHNPSLLNSENISYLSVIDCTKSELVCAGIDTAQYQMNYVYNMAYKMLFIALMIVLSLIGQNIFANIIGLKVARDKRKELFSSVIKMKGTDFIKFSESSLITRATNDIQLIQNMSVTILQSVAYAPILVCVGLFFAINSAPTLIWIIVLGIIMVVIAAYFMVKITIPYFSRMQQLFDSVNLKAREALSGVYVTRAFNREKYEEDRFDVSNNNLYKVQLLTGRITSIITPLLTLGYNAMTVLVILVGGIQINTGNIQVGDLVAFSSYSALIVGGFVSIGMFVGGLPRVNVAVDRIESAINDAHKNGALDDSVRNGCELNFESIRFEDVSFSYDVGENKHYVLKNISFSVKKGETCGLIGTVGSGKSSIVKLLNRRFEPCSGNILLNGKNIKEFPLKTYRDLFSYAPQQSFLFSGTVEENVGYGIDKDKNDCSDDCSSHQCLTDKKQRIIKALEDAQLQDFDLSKNLSQDSTNISGGQRQRLSLARAFAHNSDVFIFDDCFTALDFSTEKNLRKVISKKNQTKIIVSSRLASIANADKIIVLDQGEVVGCGTHTDLLKNCAEYINIAKAQMEEIQ